VSYIQSLVFAELDGLKLEDVDWLDFFDGISKFLGGLLGGGD
jgi:hypothetical protein